MSAVATVYLEMSHPLRVDEALRLRARVAELEAESGMSWNGFNLRGDAKSVAELRRLMNSADRLTQLEPYLNGLLASANQRVAELEKKREKLREAIIINCGHLESVLAETVL